MAVTVFSLMNVALGMSARSETRTIFTRDIVADRRQLTLYGGTLVAIVLATQLDILNRILDTVPLTGGQWLVCLLLGGGLIVVEEIIKLVDAAPGRRRSLTGRTITMAPMTRPADGGRTGGRRPRRRGRGADEAPKRIKFPTALTVLAIVLGVVWLASFFIPSGVYELDPRPAARSRAATTSCPTCDDVAEGEPCVDKSIGAQFKLLWRAPPNGLYGVESTATQYVERRRGGLPLRLGADLLLRARRRRVHHR